MCRSFSQAGKSYSFEMQLVTIRGIPYSAVGALRPWLSTMNFVVFGSGIVLTCESPAMPPQVGSDDLL